MTEQWVLQRKGGRKGEGGTEGEQERERRREREKEGEREGSTRDWYVFSNSIKSGMTK